MSAWVLGTLAIVALLTSIISAILGMAGGVMLLAVMMCFLTHAESIPTHAAVQIASNGTRVLAFLRHVDRSAFGRFLIGVVPGASIGLLLLWSLGQMGGSEPYLKTLMGLYIVGSTFIPRGRTHRHAAGSWWDFPLMGLVAGVAALTVGAVGPLIAPLFARRNFSKERLIATKAVCQLSIHVFKIPAFILMRELDLSKLGLLAVIMIVMVIPGTLIGKRLQQGVSESQFRIAFRVALILAGLKVLVIDGLIKMPIWTGVAAG